MKRETTEAIWREYENGRDYNAALELYDNVETNENFVQGKQWEGLNAPDLPKPVLNFLRRAVAWCIAVIHSDDIAISVEALDESDEIALLTSLIEKSVLRVYEINSIKKKNRMVKRNGAVHGDAAMYFWFDPSIENGQAVKGEIVSEILEGKNVHFGNPFLAEVQSQPYIILAQRKLVSEVREEARAAGLNESDISAITSDSDEINTNSENEEAAFDLCTVLIKLRKVNGTVHATKCTRTVILRKEYDTGLKLYPVAWFIWEEAAGSYHGNAVVTGLVPNQIAANRLFAMAIRSVEMSAFPITVYDKTKFPDGWTNKVGQAIGAINPSGGKLDEFFASIRGGDFSEQVLKIIDMILERSKEFIGANDAAMGNVKPDNAQAIIATQQASIVPLELQKLNSDEYDEQCVRIIVDMMRVYYGSRRVSAEGLENEDGSPLAGTDGSAVKSIMFDFARLENPNIRLNVSIGAASYWSEIVQDQYIDNLFKMGVITDAIAYLEYKSDNNLPKKKKIIADLKRARSQMQQSVPQQGYELPDVPNAEDAAMGLQQKVAQTPGALQ